MQLQNHGRTYTAGQFLVSTEYRMYEIRADFLNLFHRQADATGLNYWANQSGLDVLTVEIDLAGSTEFININNV